MSTPVISVISSSARINSRAVVGAGLDRSPGQGSPRASAGVQHQDPVAQTRTFAASLVGAGDDARLHTLDKRASPGVMAGASNTAPASATSLRLGVRLLGREVLVEDFDPLVEAHEGRGVGGLGLDELGESSDEGYRCGVARGQGGSSLESLMRCGEGCLRPGTSPLGALGAVFEHDALDEVRRAVRHVPDLDESLLGESLLGVDPGNANVVLCRPSIAVGAVDAVDLRTVGAGFSHDAMGPSRIPRNPGPGYRSCRHLLPGPSSQRPASPMVNSQNL